MCSGSYSVQSLHGLGVGRGSGVWWASVAEERFTDIDFDNDAVIFVESMEALIGVLERQSKKTECLGLQVSWIFYETFNDLLGTAVSSVSVCSEYQPHQEVHLSWQ